MVVGGSLEKGRVTDRLCSLHSPHSGRASLTYMEPLTSGVDPLVVWDAPNNCAVLLFLWAQRSPLEPQAHRVKVERRGLISGREQQPERMEPSHLCSASQRRQGRRRAEAGQLVSWTPRTPTLRRYSGGLRTEAVVVE